MSYTVLSGNPGNLNIIVQGGSYEITPAPVTITTSSAEKVYDGSALMGTVTVEGLAGEPDVFYTSDQVPVFSAAGSARPATSETIVSDPAAGIDDIDEIFKIFNK